MTRYHVSLRHRATGAIYEKHFEFLSERALCIIESRPIAEVVKTWEATHPDQTETQVAK